MHALTFSLKRAYWRCELTMRSGFALLGLTPARYDLLDVLVGEGGIVEQPSIARLLGVCAKTVSVMLGSLETLSLVERWTDPEDGRRKVVKVTEEGRDRHRVAHEALALGVAVYLLQRMFGERGGRLWEVTRVWEKGLRTIETRLQGQSRLLPWREGPPARQREAEQRVPGLKLRWFCDDDLWVEWKREGLEESVSGARRQDGEALGGG